MNWDDIRYFLAVARHASLTRAARLLRVSQSTVSRRIDLLEQQLGVRVFTRHQTGYRLTPEGEALLLKAAVVEESMLSLDTSLAALTDSEMGTVRLATSESLAMDILLPAMSHWYRQHKGIELEIITGTATANLTRREADIALRIVRPNQGNLKMRRLYSLSYSLYASDAYLQAAGLDAGLTDLSALTMIGWDQEHAHLTQVRWLEQNWPQPVRQLRLSSLPLQLAAASEGFGVALVPDFWGARHGLTALTNYRRLLVNDLWLVMQAELASTQRVRAVADFVTDVVQRAHFDFK